ncbi:MAG: hypothetical protein ACXV8U_19860 [Methylobacter sp.]
MTHSPIGAIGLESMMSRANILFTSGYRFKGELNLDNLEAGFVAVVGCISKFEYRMHFETQGNFRWQPAGAYDKPINVIDSDDINQEFGQLCRHSLSLLDGDRHCPMQLTVIRSSNSSEFIIAQTSEHTYLDARSSEVIFDWIVGYYNALSQDNTERLGEIVAAAKDLKTLHSDEMMKILSAGGHDRDANIESLTAYPIADVGEYAIPLDTVPACLENYKKQRFTPIMQFFDVQQLLELCRARYPEVSRNSVICAALAKGFYNLNRYEKNKSEKHIISFKMLSDLLSPELRQAYCGNYIAFVPVSVDGDKPIQDIAKDIHDRTRQIKTAKLDLTVFELTEQAIEDGLVGTVEEPLSFVVTNWSNYRFLANSEYLHGCQSLRHQSGVNIDPVDTGGAVLVNRPILVVNLSPNSELCLSFFPSLRSEQENLKVAGHIGDVFCRSC